MKKDSILKNGLEAHDVKRERRDVSVGRTGISNRKIYIAGICAIFSQKAKVDDDNAEIPVKLGFVPMDSIYIPECLTLCSERQRRKNEQNVETAKGFSRRKECSSSVLRHFSTNFYELRQLQKLRSF